MSQQTKSRSTSTVLPSTTPDFCVSLHVTTLLLFDQALSQAAQMSRCVSVWASWTLLCSRVFSDSLSSSQQNVRAIGVEHTAARARSWKTERRKRFREEFHALGQQVWKESAPMPHSRGWNLPLPSYRGMGVRPWPSEGSTPPRGNLNLPKNKLELCK